MTFLELTTKHIGIGSATVGDLFSAILTLLVCLLVIHLIVRVLHRVLARSKLDARVQKYVMRAIKLLLYLLTALIVVDSLGIRITSLVALVSIGSLGVTLAAEDILGNVAGGFVILASRPFTIGDFIEVSGTSGTVEEITLNHTKLVTLDGLMVMIPNKSLASSKMTNYTTLGHRRVEQKVSASYDAPTETVKAACRKALEMTPNLLQEPGSTVFLSSYGSSSIEYCVFCWCDSAYYWAVCCTLRENLREAFAEFNVEMSYDHLNVHVVEDRTKSAGRNVD